jgi:oligopeptide/dipeptide ABC transporter ATP-binding protein
MGDTGADERAVDGGNLVDVTDVKVHFDLSKSRNRPRVIRAVDGVTLGIKRHETLGLVGESGCGKSTLGRAILRLVEPTSGSVVFDGINLVDLGDEQMRKARRRMQMIFQDPYGSLNPRMTIGQTLEEPLVVHRIARGDEAETLVEEILTAVGLPADAKARYPHEFSGGQRQRAAIARALMTRPDLIVADEAVSALDVSIRAQIVNLMRRLQLEFGLTYVFIAHDLAVVRHVSDRIAVMYLGKVVELARTGALHQRPLHPYTASLLSAIPVPDPTVELARERIILHGDVPSPANPPAGCTFHPRCWLRGELGNPEICSIELPPLSSFRDSEDDALVACHFADEMASRAARVTVAVSRQRTTTPPTTGGNP